MLQSVLLKTITYRGLIMVIWVKITTWLHKVGTPYSTMLIGLNMRDNCQFWGISSVLLWGHFTSFTILCSDFLELPFLITLFPDHSFYDYFVVWMGFQAGTLFVWSGLWHGIWTPSVWAITWCTKLFLYIFDRRTNELTNIARYRTGCLFFSPVIDTKPFCAEIKIYCLYKWRCRKIPPLSQVDYEMVLQAWDPNFVRHWPTSYFSSIWPFEIIPDKRSLPLILKNKSTILMAAKSMATKFSGRT